ncbi:L-aspartate oxidase [Haematospirillum jordaniae]|uniref:L-aspartate oxidase n=2 Tax=Haematospirillum jordaniae TaxID=1549855 RepID=UPI001FD86A9A|nr:L-aspartate oxidase [Haematospirillum jordaniae]
MNGCWLSGVRNMDQPVVVVGSGAAGMATALALAPLPVVLITKTNAIISGSTPWAQGGMAAVLSPDDHVKDHAADTIAAGAGLTDSRMAHLLARESASYFLEVLKKGLPADRKEDGSLCLGREAAHSTNRILHINGDRSGLGLASWLVKQVQAAEHIAVLTSTMAAQLTSTDSRIDGIWLYSDTMGWFHQPARAVVLATGGWGQLWPGTTNPVENTGDGLAIAAQAGAMIADMEFMQFHPTALSVPSRTMHGFSRLPLLTEALRGAGAILLNEHEHRFVDELAPRDIVARAIEAERLRGQTVFLDLRPALSKKDGNTFPQVIEICRSHGLDPRRTPIPVEPAAHYAMGGIVTDCHGRTSCQGLWAVGEVACTGIHGANRLASNSLPEALVFGQRAATDIQSTPSVGRKYKVEQRDRTPLNTLPDPGCLGTLRLLAGQALGISRHGKEMGRMLAFLDERTAKAPSGMHPRAAMETHSLLITARLVCTAALERKESRGAHMRIDFPNRDPALAHRNKQILTPATLTHHGTGAMTSLSSHTVPEPFLP